MANPIVKIDRSISIKEIKDIVRFMNNDLLLDISKEMDYMKTGLLLPDGGQPPTAVGDS